MSKFNSIIFIILFLVFLYPITSILNPSLANHDPNKPNFIPDTYCDENGIWRDNTLYIYDETGPTGHTHVQDCPTGTRCEEDLIDVGAQIDKTASCQPIDPATTFKFDKGPDPAGLTQIEEVFKRVLQVSVGLAFVALLVVLVVASFKFLTSGGEPKAIASARDAMTWAFLGVLFLAIGWLVLLLIKEITGVDVTIFNVKILQ